MISCLYQRLLMPLLLSTAVTAQAISTDETRNVILIIGDGMDDQQITIARNYLKGAQGQLTLDNMPVRSAVQVLTVDENHPEKAVYVADSANSATSMATGRITSRGRIGTSAQQDHDIKNIAEYAKASGYGVGIVTSASITDATPASFISHINQRYCESPSEMVDAKIMGEFKTNCSNDLKQNQGSGSIAEQIAASPYDILLGGGQRFFNDSIQDTSHTVLDSARQNGFYISDNKSSLTQIPSDQKVLGLFADKHLPIRLQGEGGRTAEKPQPSLLNRIDWRIGDVEMPATMTCEANPDYGDTPSLQLMTSSALEYLSSERHSRGFFLMVESASIDKQSHARNPCGSIGELEQLDEVLETALKYAQGNPNTLILVTADHGQAAQLIPDDSLFKPSGVAVYTPGHVARIETPEGAIMAVNYATNDFPIEEHTGVNVPLYTNEVGRKEVGPMIKQTDIFGVMMNHLNLTTH